MKITFKLFFSLSFSYCHHAFHLKLTDKLRRGKFGHKWEYFASMLESSPGASVEPDDNWMYGVVFSQQSVSGVIYKLIRKRGFSVDTGGLFVRHFSPETSLWRQWGQGYSQVQSVRGAESLRREITISEAEVSKMVNRTDRHETDPKSKEGLIPKRIHSQVSYLKEQYSSRILKMWEFYLHPSASKPLLNCWNLIFLTLSQPGNIQQHFLSFVYDLVCGSSAMWCHVYMLPVG